MSETFTLDNPIKTEKIRTHSAKIVVEYTTGKPYYSIEWYDPAKQEYFLGYSSYNIENVLGWLSERFEIVETHKTNADRIRAMSDEELAYWLLCPHGDLCESPGALDEDCMKCTLQWLKQPEGEP